MLESSPCVWYVRDKLLKRGEAVDVCNNVVRTRGSPLEGLYGKI